MNTPVILAYVLMVHWLVMEIEIAMTDLTKQWLYVKTTSK